VVVNALFAATARRFRSLPFVKKEKNRCNEEDGPKGKQDRLFILAEALKIRCNGKETGNA
jgi:hypothetical protein